MKSDARYLINMRKMKKPTNKVARGVIDARKILNSKVGKRQSFNTRSSNNIERSFSNLRNRIGASSFMNKGNRLPEKRVKLASDGNIVITSKAKDSVVPNTMNTGSIRPQAPRWVPSDVELASLEHVGIEDVLDMDTLPSAVVATNNISQGRIGHRSLADEIMEMRNTMVADQVETSSQTCCVNVSNLHISVSKQDIMELFGDVGLIKRAEMPLPGFAVIEYFDPSDAVKACDLYHNRLLDGLPMQCSFKPQTTQRSSISQRLGERVQPPSTSISSRAMLNPRNVRFTVKLT